MRLQVSEIISVLGKSVLPKLRSLESSLRPINRLPKDIFILIPSFFADRNRFGYYLPMHRSLIVMTHVCQSWRNTLISTPSLWKRINFSTYKSKQAMGFLHRSGDHLLDIYQLFKSDNDAEPFLSATLHNLYRLRRLEITVHTLAFEHVVARFTGSAPMLEHLYMSNEVEYDGNDMELYRNTIFRGQFPKLLSLTLYYFRVDLCTFNTPSLTRFDFTTLMETSPQHLVSFIERCPSLEFIHICLCLTPQPPAPPPRERVRLGALKTLKFEEMTSTCGLLDQLILPKCTEMLLSGKLTRNESGIPVDPSVRIHPSSIDHLPVTRGVTRATIMPNGCVLSGPNGRLRFDFFPGSRENFDAGYLTSLSSISVSEIRELSVGMEVDPHGIRRPWKQAAGRVRGAFEVLKKVEDLSIVNCEVGPFFAALGSTADGNVLLPELRRLTIYIGREDLDVGALIQCSGVRFDHSRPLGEVTIVFEKQPGKGVILEMELLKGFVGEMNYRVGKTPELEWHCEDEYGC